MGRMFPFPIKPPKALQTFSPNYIKETGLNTSEESIKMVIVSTDRASGRLEAMNEWLDGGSPKRVGQPEFGPGAEI